MALFETNVTRPAAPHPASADLLRLALALMTFAALSLGIMLAARLPDSPLAAVTRTGVDWHGNVATTLGD